jgi:hypothetical protein
VITALLALFVWLAAHLSPAPVATAPAAAVHLTSQVIDQPAGSGSSSSPAVPVTEPDAPPATDSPWDGFEPWAPPATDSPMCVPELGIVVDCWIP